MDLALLPWSRAKIVRCREKEIACTLAIYSSSKASGNHEVVEDWGCQDLYMQPRPASMIDTGNKSAVFLPMRMLGVRLRRGAPIGGEISARPAGE